jgi:putative radical SAM-modified peptide
MENAMSEVEVLAEGEENSEMVNACCVGGTGNARK